MTPTGFPGTKRTTVLGSEGPCDSAGYRVKPTPFWRNNLTSIMGDGYCRNARVSNRELNRAQDFDIHGYNTPYLGDFNDNVGLIHAYA